MVYKFEHVVNDISSMYFKNTPMGARQEIYADSWLAMNEWLESRLKKQRGGSINSLGSFGWEIKQHKGETNIRPIFLIADSFVKNYNVKKERVFYAPRTTPIEEINYSQVAIKYTNNLTKDMVFAGLRDIIKKIGEYIAAGSEVDIAFSFGTLSAKERKVKFDFNLSRLADLLPDLSETGVPYDLKHTAYYLEDEEDHIEENKKSDFEDTKRPVVPTLPPLKNSFTKIDEGLESGQSDDDHLKSRNETPSSLITNTDTVNPGNFSTRENESYNVPEIKLADDASSISYSAADSKEDHLSQILDAIANRSKHTNREEFRKKASEAVLEQAFKRSLNDLESQAKFDDINKKAAEDDHECWKSMLRAKKDKFREDGSTLKQALDKQFVELSQRQKDAAIEKREGIIPVMISEKADPDFQRKREVLRVSLLNQMEDSIARKKEVKKINTMKEKDYLDQLQLEIDLEHALRRTKHLERQSTLLESWERDGHVRNLRKVQSYGQDAVQDYIRKNLGVEEEFMEDPGKKSMGRSLSMSIGYDPRKSRS